MHYWIRIVILVVCFQHTASIVIAQPDSLWSRTFGGGDLDVCNSVQQTTDGGYILGGYTYSYGAGYRDFWLVKTDANGDSLWSRTFGGSSIDECWSVQQTTDGGYILGGYTYSYGAGYSDSWLVKTGSEGTPVWERRIPAPQEFTLSVYPNPFNPTTTISFDIAEASSAALSVYNLSGQIVETLVNRPMQPGQHTVSFDGTGLSSGIYFYRLTAGSHSMTKKMVLMK